MIIKEIPLTKVLYSAYNSLDFADSKKYNLSFNCYWKADFVTFTFVVLSVIVDKYIQVLYQFFPHWGIPIMYGEQQPGPRTPRFDEQDFASGHI